MDKYKFLFISVLFIIFITLIANQIELYNATKSITGNMPGEVNASITGIMGFIQTYINLLTFNINGFPDILNALIFYPINIVTIYLLAEIIKDIIPFA